MNYKEVAKILEKNSVHYDEIGTVNDMSLLLMISQKYQLTI